MILVGTFQLRILCDYCDFETKISDLVSPEKLNETEIHTGVRHKTEQLIYNRPCHTS